MAENKQRPGRQLSSDKRGNSDADRRGGPKRWQFNLNQDCVEKLRNQSVADFLRKPMKRNSRKALTTRQRMAARERM
ncbi:MAG: hypothetical protein GKR99_14600 [Rhodobacteraceae bacterium]|nr:hypothetical protein [Paracoccaceae bacterium]